MLQVADTFGGVNDLGAGDALNIDVAANQPHQLPLSVPLEDFQVDAGPLRSLEAISSLVQTEPLDRLTGDLGDPVTAFQSRFPRRSPADHSDQAQALWIALQLDPQAHEISIDHGIEVFQLVGGQVAGE